MSQEILPWHAELLSEMINNHELGELPHALGLTAPVGWGVELLAEQLVRTLLNLQAKLPIEQTAHPDLYWLDPEGANIPIEEIRSVRDYAVKTRQIASVKVVVIVRAERLNIAASNALLKTLEEPPPNTLIVLCSEYWGRVLPTVRSRCQEKHIRLSEKVVMSWLEAQGQQLGAGEFALAGYAPFTAMDTSMRGMDQWLDKITRQGPNAAPAADLPADLVSWLSVWYRAILQRISMLLSAEDSGRSQVHADRAYQLMDFADELLQIRRQLQTLNIRTADLLVEKLIYQWSQMTVKFNV